MTHVGIDTGVKDGNFMISIPADAELTQRHAEIPAWDDMDEALKPGAPR